MRTMTMNRKITLQQYREGQGHGGENAVIAQTTVYAAVRKPSLTFQATQMSAGLVAALTVTLWRSEFEQAEYTHMLVDDVIYRIESVGVGINDLLINVAVARN